MSSSCNKSSERNTPRATLHPAGNLLSMAGLVTVLAGLLVAAWFGQTILVILLGLFLAAAGVSWLWSHWSLAGVSCIREFSETRLFPGEITTLKLRLENRKILPLPWIHLSQEIPEVFLADMTLPPADKPGCRLMVKSASLLWYTAVNWQHTLSGERRGYFPLGPISVTSGDIFGFYPRSAVFSAKDNIIVYPRIYPMSLSWLPSRHPLGETVAERRIFEDPSRVIGVRDYTANDSLRHVHWKASARHQTLQVKVFEPTTTLNVAIFLAADGFLPSPEENDSLPIPGPPEPLNEDDFELGISTAASLAHTLISEHGSAAGLYTNACLADTSEPARITPASTAEQLMELLEALAKVTASPARCFEDFLQTEIVGMPWGTTFVFIVAALSPELAAIIANLGHGGEKPVVLIIGEHQDSRAEYPITCHSIRRPRDLGNIGAVEVT
ncbi:DUF58 domain-containing protein [Chloroflexota bacterium]